MMQCKYLLKIVEIKAMYKIDMGGGVQKSFSRTDPMQIFLTAQKNIMKTYWMNLNFIAR